MFIPFLPKLDAMHVLEQDYEERSQRSEYEAELGSTYFYGGMASWDAESRARMDMEEMIEDTLATPEGQLRAAQVEAAVFMTDAITMDMRIYDALDYADPLGAALRYTGASLGTVLPEFIPGITRDHFLHGIDLSTEDIPF
jgi:hypothetical protein